MTSDPIVDLRYEEQGGDVRRTPPEMTTEARLARRQETDLRARYYADPKFKAIVDQLQITLLGSGMTTSEVIGALFLATFKMNEDDLPRIADDGTLINPRTGQPLA